MYTPGKDEPITNQDNDITNSEDLHDSPKDQEQLKAEPVIFDLPEVKDIPGQQNIVPMPLGELADTTIASDDEEGVGILDFEDEESDTITNSETKVSNQGGKDETETSTVIRDGAQLKEGEENIANAREQATNGIDNDPGM